MRREDFGTTRFFTRWENLDGISWIDDFNKMEMCENCGTYLPTWFSDRPSVETYGDLAKHERKCLIEAGEPLDDPSMLVFKNFGRAVSGRVVTHWRYPGVWDVHIVYARNPYGNHNLVYVCGNESVCHGNTAVIRRMLTNAPWRNVRKVVNFLYARRKRIFTPYEPPRDGGLDGRFSPPSDWDRYQIKKILCKRYGLPEPIWPDSDDVPF